MQIPATQPWWLPVEWQVVTLCLLAGICITQIWKGWVYSRTGQRPVNWQTRSFAIFCTALIIFVAHLLEEQTWQYSLRLGLLWGLPQPFIYVVIQRLLRKYAPHVAAAVGEQRRREIPRDDPDVWSEERRERIRAMQKKSDSLFGDTAANAKVERD